MSDNSSLPEHQKIPSSLTVTIRLLEVENAPEMFNIEQQAHSYPWSLTNLADCFGRLYRVYGAYDGQTLVGFAIVQQIVDELTLLDICIVPNYQGLGLGKQLLDHLMIDARQYDAVVVMLEVRQSNQAAIGLYHKLGFSESGRRKGYYPCDTGREDAILMDYSIEAA
ncbi:ribosomal protein S18-alanine N-acetyltransferase [Shewanella japonica]|uniref:ribosomal protein S18-alanine N-acetyltransferase n=1 Tax=Shewanella japonica TaxID=93973 RepID=UPI000E7532EC